MEKPKKILIADDNRDLAKVSKAIMEKLGFIVVVAFNGQEVLEVAKKEKPDIILMDLHMPLKTGSQAATAIRESQWGKDIPIVIITGSLDNADSLFKKNKAITDYLIKPYRPDKLMEKIKNFL